MGNYDEALVKAIRGEGAGELDSIVRRRSPAPVHTENDGNQNAPDIGEPDGVSGNGGEQEDSRIQALMELLSPGHPG